jgi:hypothetical protein
MRGRECRLRRHYSFAFRLARRPQTVRRQPPSSDRVGGGVVMLACLAGTAP